MTYYIYALVDPRDNKPFYIGKGKGNRVQQHLKFKDGNQNPYKDRKIKSIIDENLEVKIDFLLTDITDEQEAYKIEEDIIKQIGLDNLTNITENSRPPSKRGWHPSQETLNKRSKSLQGIPRTKEWRNNLSNSKQGSKNGMFGKKIPCTMERKIAIIQNKNKDRLDKLILLFQMLKEGVSIRNIAKQTGYGTSAIISIKKDPSLHFHAFPMLIQFKTS